MCPDHLHKKKHIWSWKCFHWILNSVNIRCITLYNWSTAFWECGTCLLAWFITLDVFVLLQKPSRAGGLNAPLHQFAVIKRTADQFSSTRLTVFTNLLHCVRINCYTSNRLFHLSIRQLGCQICGPPDTTQDTTTTGGFQFHTSQTWSGAAVGVPTTAGRLLRPPRDPFVAHLSASHFLDEQRNWTNIPKTRAPVDAVSCLFLQTITEHRDGKSGGIETRAKVQKQGKIEFAVRCLASRVTQSPSDTVLNWSQT